MLPNVSINLTSTVSPKTGNRNSSHFWVGFHKLPSFWVSPFIHVHLPSLDHHYTILYHHYCYTIVLPWLSHHFLIHFPSFHISVSTCKQLLLRQVRLGNWICLRAASIGGHRLQGRASHWKSLGGLRAVGIIDG